MGREEAKAQSSAAQKEKEHAAFEKKQAQRDKQWEVGAKDMSSALSAAEKATEEEKRKAERKAIEDAEGAMGKNTKTKVKPGEKPKMTKEEKAKRAMLAAQALEKAEKEAAAKAKAAKKAGGAAAAAVPPEDGVAALLLTDGSEEAPASS